MRPTNSLVSGLALLLLLTIILSVTPISVAETKGPASNGIIFVPVDNDPETVVDSMGTVIDASVHRFNYQDIASYIGDRSDIKKAVVRSISIDILVNPAPVYWNYYEGNLTREDIAAIEGVPVQAVTYVYYNETSNETYAEFGAFPGVGINPFAFRDVRYALNFLVDREWVCNDLLGGYGEPKYMFIGLNDPMMYYLLDIYLKYRFPYSVYLADNYITNALQAVGAEKIDGKWYYDGNPINIFFYIRVEDERRDIGDRIADLLENLGFNVTRVYINWTEVFRNIYGADPRNQTWHLYTEGWYSPVPARMPDKSKIAFFGSAEYGPLPTWGSGLWKYRNETIESLIDQIYNGEYSGLSDYLAKYRLATEMIIQESIRVWIADVYKLDLYEDYIANVVKGYNGILNQFSLRSMNNTLTGIVRIGHPYGSITPTYNPYGSTLTITSSMITMATYDPLITTDPVTGAWRPFRATYEVLAPSSTPSITVPSDAVVWNASANEWVPVAPGTLSVAVVKFNLSKLIGSHWHNGMNITWADVIATWAYIWEITEDPVKSSLEEQVYKPVIDNIVGLRFDTDNNILEVYTNYYNSLDPDEIAGMVDISPSVPLEIWEAISYLAFNESKYALTYTRASNDGLPLLNLLNSTHASDIGDLLATFYSNTTVYNEVSKYTTVNGVNYLSYDEFLERINASRDWINAHGHALISDGAFYLDSIGDTINLTAFRDETYPFTPSDFYIETLQANITNIDINPIIIGEPAQINVTVEGPDSLAVKYAVKVVGTMDVLLIDNATRVEPGRYTIYLPSSLTSTMDNNTLYELIVVAFSEDNNTYDVEVAPLPVEPDAYTEEAVEGGTTETIETSTSTSNVTVEVNATDDVTIHVSVFENTEPIPNVSEPGVAEYTGYAIDVYVNDTDAVNWPMYIEVEYNESVLPPDVAEESLAIYYYNETTHSWKKCSNTGVDVDANKVWAYITREEYEAGIGNVFAILGIPPAVGGKLVMYNSNDGLSSTTILVFVISLISAGGASIVVLKRYKKC